MREVWKKLLAVLVVVLMMTNQTVSALAYETPEGDDKETGTELVLEDLDPKSLGIRYLGEEGEIPASPAEDLDKRFAFDVVKCFSFNEVKSDTNLI